MKRTIILSSIFLFWAFSVKASPDYFSQINAQNLNLAAGREVIVAVLDSGTQLDNPYLKNNLWQNPNEIPNDGLDNDRNGFIDDYNGWDFIANNYDPSPKFDSNYINEGIAHGTAIAGLIAANNTEINGVSGLVPNGKIMSLRVLAGTGEGDAENVIKAIKYSVNNGADVINLSFVGYEESLNLSETIKWAYDRGVVVVAAAGNGNASSSVGLNLSQTKAYPACQSFGQSQREILTVASVDSNNRKADFSNYGGGCVNISAPGQEILSISYKSSTIDELSSTYALWSGTSFSAALVSAAAALIKSQSSNLSAKNIIESITLSAKDINLENPTYQNQLGGLLDVKAALAYKSRLTAGRLIKTKTNTAVYYVDVGGYRQLFTSENVFFSWFNPPWSSQPVETVTQTELDALKIGRNITVRPGNLVKFDNSDLIYVVTNEQKLCSFASEEAVDRLYGSDWNKKIIKLTSSFQADYLTDTPCVLTESSTYPDGSLIKYSDQNQVYYIDDGQKFPLINDSIRANSILDSWIISNVKTEIDYTNGPAIIDYKNIIFPYKLN